MTTLVMDGHATVEDIVRVALTDTPVAIAPEVLRRLDTFHLEAGRLAATTTVYGQDTGVGANRSTDVPTDSGHFGMRLLRSHAVDAGEPLAEPVVRAMLAVRLNQLCHDGSGIRADIPTGLQRMLNENALPVVLRHGAIGTGDLTALAGTALTLVGERAATGPLTAMRTWDRQDALPFISSSALTIARGCLALHELRQLARASELVFMMSFLGLRGNASALSSRAAAAACADGVEDVAARLRALLRTSGVQQAPTRIQDPYGLRTFPVTQGLVQTALASLAGQVQRLLGAAQENPLFDVPNAEVVHHGSFHQAALAHYADAAALAQAQASSAALSRIRMMNEPEYTGQAPFLAGPGPGTSGLMMLEYVAACAVSTLRLASIPCSTSTTVLSRGTEDDATFAPQAVAQLEDAAEAQALLTGCELLAACRLLHLRGIDLELRGAVGTAFASTSALSRVLEDRDLRDDVSLAQQIVRDLGRTAARTTVDLEVDGIA